MYRIALKMLVGNRGKFFAMMFGVLLTSLIITQQLSIFVGLMSRTIGFIVDMGQADLWVMDPKVQYIDDIKPLQDTKLYQVRGVEGVAWAVPLFKGQIKARLENGAFQTCNVIGLDDATLVGGPPTMISGRLEDLRRADSVIVDQVGAQTKLAKPGKGGASSTPLQIGDVLELNDNRAVVVGVGSTTRTFQSQPTVFTTYSRAIRFAPRERKLLSFVLVKAREGEDLGKLKASIANQTGLAAYTQAEFKSLTIGYFMRNTGIPINFGLSVGLGFMVGIAIVGQTFYSFVIENTRYLGILKAMGASNALLFHMILLQTALVGVLGCALGMGLAALTGVFAKGTELSFLMPWQIPVLTALATALIALLTTLVSIRKVVKLEPGIVFRG